MAYLFETESPSTQLMYALMPTEVEVVPTHNWEYSTSATSPVYCIPEITHLESNTILVEDNVYNSNNDTQYICIEMCEETEEEIPINNHDVNLEEEIDIAGNASHSPIKYEIHTTTDEIQTNEVIFLGEKATEKGNIIMVKYSLQEEHNYALRHYVTRHEINLPKRIPEKNIRTTKRSIWYTCDICNFKTRMKDSFEFHMQSTSHEDAVSATPENCETVLVENMMENVLQTEENQGVKCDTCNFTTKCQESLQIHLLSQEHRDATKKKVNQIVKVEEEEEETDESEDEIEAKFKCSHCKYKTNWKNNMTKHVTAKHTSSDKIQWLYCADCPYRAKVRENLVKHWHYAHNKRESPKWLYCDKCAYKTKWAPVLKNHVISAHTELEEINWWECQECPFRSKLKNRLTWHIKTKHQPVWLSCEKCHYKTIDKNLLLSHFRTHSKIEKWFKCKQCPYQSYRFRMIEEHLRSLHGMEVLDFEFIEIRFTPLTPTSYESSACFETVDEGGVKCKFCAFFSSMQVEMERHIRDSHNLVKLE